MVVEGVDDRCAESFVVTYRRTAGLESLDMGSDDVPRFVIRPRERARPFEGVQLSVSPSLDGAHEQR